MDPSTKNKIVKSEADTSSITSHDHGQTSAETIKFLDGDESLRTFPLHLQNLVNQYCSIHLTKELPITRRLWSKPVSLNKDAQGNSVRFKAQGDEPLLVARYKYGRRRQIMVAKAAHGGHWNNAVEHIIFNHGKNNLSEWAVWYGTRDRYVGTNPDDLIWRCSVSNDHIGNSEKASSIPEPTAAALSSNELGHQIDQSQKIATKRKGASSCCADRTVEVNNLPKRLKIHSISEKIDKKQDVKIQWEKQATIPVPIRSETSQTLQNGPTLGSFVDVNNPFSSFSTLASDILAKSLENVHEGSKSRARSVLQLADTQAEHPRSHSNSARDQIFTRRNSSDSEAQQGFPSNSKTVSELSCKTPARVKEKQATIEQSCNPDTFQDSHSICLHTSLSIKSLSSDTTGETMSQSPQLVNNDVGKINSASSPSIVHPTSPVSIKIFFTKGGVVLRRREFSMCVTVQKLFAHAQTANIATKETALLSIKCGTKTRFVVRDDIEDMDQLKKVVATGGAQEIIVTSEN